jgi:colicin import membrane protein
MRERREDTAQAVALAIGLHVLVAALLLGGLWWTESAAPAGAPGAVTADVVSADALSASMQRALDATPREVEPAPLPAPEPEFDPDPLPQSEPEPPAPQPAPQPEPQPAPQPAPQPEPQPAPQDFIPVPDQETREAVVEQPAPRKADTPKPQEAKRKQEQVDLTERERQLEAQRQEQKRQEERDKAETERRLAEIRRKRAAVAREAQLAEQRLQQLADARSGPAAEEAARADATASAPPGSGGTDDGLQARYAAALQAAITAKWTRPDSIPPGALCRLVIRQLPGGEVVSAEVGSPCAYDEQGRRSIEAAVLKAQPLPYAGFERVFQRTVTLNFRAPE